MAMGGADEIYVLGGIQAVAVQHQVGRRRPAHGRFIACKLKMSQRAVDLHRCGNSIHRFRKIGDADKTDRLFIFSIAAA